MFKQLQWIVKRIVKKKKKKKEKEKEKKKEKKKKKNKKKKNNNNNSNNNNNNNKEKKIAMITSDYSMSYPITTLPWAILLHATTTPRLVTHTPPGMS